MPRRNEKNKKSIDTINKLVINSIKKHLSKMKLNETYNTEFGVFKKTAEKELTMIAWIEVPGLDIKTCKDRVKTVAESFGWMFKESPTMQYFGVVIRRKE